MLNFDRALNDDRLMKAITGLSASEFNKLVERFREEFSMKRGFGMKQELNKGTEKESLVAEEQEI